MQEVATLLPEPAFQWAETTHESILIQCHYRKHTWFHRMQQRKASLWTSEERNSFWSSWYAVRLRTTPFQNWPIWGCRLVGSAIPKPKNRYDSLNHYSQLLEDRDRRMRSLRSLLIHSEFICNTEYMWTCPSKWSMLHHCELMLKNALWPLAKIYVFRIHLPIRLREQIICGSW